jgi:hypothetical protein
MINIKKCVSNSYISIGLLSPMIMFAIGVEFYVIFVVGVALGLVFLFFNNYYKSLGFFLPLCFLSFAVIYVFITRPLYVGGLFASIVTVLSFLAAYWLAFQDRKAVVSGAFYALIIFYSFFVWSIFKYGMTPHDINSFFSDVSRNYVSAMAVFFQMMYSVSFFRLSGRLPFVTPLFTFLIALISYGRAGIAVAIALLALTTCHNFLRRGVIAKAVLVLMLGTLVFFTFVYWPVLSDFLVLNTNFKSSLDGARFKIIEDYFSHFGVFEFFSGVDIFEIESIKRFDGNPHNSFLYGHYLFGFFYLAFLFFLGTVFAFAVCFRFGQVWVYLCFGLLFIVRVFTDKLSLPGVYDYLFYYIYFIVLIDCKCLSNRLVFKCKLPFH